MTRPWVVAAVIAAAACSNKQHEQRVEFARLCGSIVPGTTTLRQAEESIFHGIPVQGPCRADLAKIGTDDVCPANPATVCVLVYEILTNDCSGPLVGGTCADWCEVRFAGAFADDTPVCARQLLRSQIVLGAPVEPPEP